MHVQAKSPAAANNREKQQAKNGSPPESQGRDPNVTVCASNDDSELATTQHTRKRQRTEYPALQLSYTS